MEPLDLDGLSHAAARLLAYNYSITGNWPMAITAYNHGLSGARRAMRRSPEPERAGARSRARHLAEQAKEVIGCGQNFHHVVLYSIHFNTILGSSHRFGHRCLGTVVNFLIGEHLEHVAVLVENFIEDAF